MKKMMVFIISSYFLDKVYSRLWLRSPIAISAPFRCQRTNLLSGEFGSVTVLSINWCHSRTSLNKSGVRPCIPQKPGFLTGKNGVSAPVL
jgi:hypothetical protein